MPQRFGLTIGARSFVRVSVHRISTPLANLPTTTASSSDETDGMFRRFH
jgi:hypothetical protein